MCICCLPERISAVVRMPALLLEHLAAILPVCRHICTNVCPGGWISACLVARLSVWRSARSLVCSSGCIWQRVWSHINLPGNLSARSAATGSIWQLFHSSAGSIICRPRFRRFICHSGRPWRFICQIWQAVDHSGHPIHLPSRQAVGHSGQNVGQSGQSTHPFINRFIGLVDLPIHHFCIIAKPIANLSHPHTCLLLRLCRFHISASLPRHP